MDSKTKHLCVNIKKTFEHHSDTQLKVHGVLDTQTATGQFHATLNKFFRLGKLPLPSPSDMFQTDTRCGRRVRQQSARLQAPSFVLLRPAGGWGWRRGAHCHKILACQAVMLGLQRQNGVPGTVLLWSRGIQNSHALACTSLGRLLSTAAPQRPLQRHHCKPQFASSSQAASKLSPASPGAGCGWALAPRPGLATWTTCC